MGKLNFKVNHIEVKGIKKRWIVNSLGMVVGIFTLLIICFSFLLYGYFFNSIQENLIGRSTEVDRVFKNCIEGDNKSFTYNALKFLEDYNDTSSVQLSIFDENDEILLTSMGFLPSDEETPQDYWKAKNSNEGIGVWKGKSLTGEKIMAVSKCVYDSNGGYLGAVRYIVSLEPLFLRTMIGVTVLIILEVLVAIFMTMSSTYFINSIINPISDICSKSKLIAQGDFNTRIEKKYDDEIGELSDTINYMAKELKESEKLKNDFISSVSHELRTPLTAIKGWAETMQICDSDPTTVKRGLDTIVREAGRLSWIVENMLDFSSINEKRVNLVKEKVDILAELGEAVYMFKNRAENEKKTLIYNEPKMISTVMGDRNRLKQIFINILDNALKYTSEGGGISVSVSEKDKKANIQVTDNGCGIPIEHLPNVTKKFYKANYLQKGSGIGLAIVEELVNLHGGELNIISEEGFGTTVNVSLPIWEDPDLQN